MAGAIFLSLSVLALLAVACFAFRYGQKFRADWRDGLFTAAAAMFLSNAAGELFAMANYGALNALWIILLVITLSSGHSVLAGFCWAFLMTKPQIGLLFAIPLLLKRRFDTVAVAVLFCLLCTLPPAFLCGKSPLELLWDVQRGGALAAWDNGTMLIPAQLFSKLSPYIAPGLLEAASMAAGAALCLWLTHRLRHETSWLVFLAPTVVCALVWSYCKPHDRVILFLTQLLLSKEFLQNRNRKIKTFCLLAIALTAWPLLYDTSSLTKILRRISLALLLYGCWRWPTMKKPCQDVHDEPFAVTAVSSGQEADNSSSENRA